MRHFHLMMPNVSLGCNVQRIDVTSITPHLHLFLALNQQQHRARLAVAIVRQN